MIGLADAAEEARQARDAPFAVLACNWRTAQIWGDLWRRWRKDRLGNREALDLQQAESALALRRVATTEWPATIEGLLAMEDEAIGVWTEQ